MKSTYNLLVFINLILLSIQGIAQNEGIPVFNNEGKIIIYNSIEKEETRTPVFESPIIVTGDTSYTLLSGRDRKVFWVHGLAGGSETWLRAADASQHNILSSFPPRKIESITDINYDESGYLREAGLSLNKIIKSSFNILDDTTQSFIIAHSQGGLVTRAYYRQLMCVDGKSLNALPNGFVTFCSPHQGAQILNSVHETTWNGETKMEYFIRDLTYTLSLGPAEDLVKKLKIPLIDLGVYTIKLPLDRIFSYKVIEKFVSNWLLDGVTLGIDKVVDPVLKPRVTEDYVVGSKILDTLSLGCADFNTNIHKIAFHAEEPQEYIFARTMQYLLEDPNNGSVEIVQHPDSLYFQANEDFILVRELQNMQSNYRKNKEKYKKRTEDLKLIYNAFACFRYTPIIKSVGGCSKIYILQPYLIDSYMQCLNCELLYNDIEDSEKIAKAFKDGEYWFNKVDSKWQAIIGAIHFEETGMQTCECEDPEKLGFSGLVNISASDTCKVHGPAAMNEQWDKNINWNCWNAGGGSLLLKRVILPNDGIVLSESQMNLPYMTLKPSVRIKDLKMENTSHMQARNNEALKEKLIQLYDGGFDDFFATEERD